MKFTSCPCGFSLWPSAVCDAAYGATETDALSGDCCSEPDLPEDAGDVALLLGFSSLDFDVQTDKTSVAAVGCDESRFS